MRDILKGCVKSKRLDFD